MSNVEASAGAGSIIEIPEDMDSVFEEYVDEAIEGLIVGFDKADTSDFFEDTADGFIDFSEINPFSENDF